MTALIIFRFIKTMRFLCLSKEITPLIFAYFKSIKFLLFLFDRIFIKTWKLCKCIVACRFILLTIKIRKIKWFFTALFFSSFHWTIVYISLITKLRKMNWFLMINIIRDLRRNSFFLNNFLFRSSLFYWFFYDRKRGCINRISLRTRYILKLIKVKSLIRLFAFNRKFPALINFFHLLRIVNLGFILCHCLKRILNWDIFSFILWWNNFFERSLLAYRIIFLRLFWWFELIFRCLKWIARLFISSWKVLTSCLKWIIKRILFLTLCKTFIHFKI